MKFPNCKNLFFLFILSFPAFSLPAEPATQTEVAEEISQPSAEQINDLLEEFIKKPLNALKRLDSIVQDINLVVNGDKITKVGQSADATNKNAKIKALMAEMIKVREIVQSIQKDSFIQVDPQSIIMLSQIADKIANHITACLDAFENKNKLAADIPHLELKDAVEQITKRGIDLSTIDLEQEFANLDATINKLDSRAQNVDISYFNRAVRFVDRTIVQPSIKHQLPKRIALSASAAFLLWYFLWFRTDKGTPDAQTMKARLEGIIKQLPKLTAEKINSNLNTAALAQQLTDIRQQAQFSTDEITEAIQKHLQNIPEKIATPLSTKIANATSWGEKLRNWIGHYPHLGVGNELASTHEWDFHYDGRNPIGKLGGIEKYLWSYDKREMAIGALGIAYVAPLYKNDLVAAKDWLTKNISDLYNRAKGGIYVKKAETSADNRMNPRYTFDDVIGLDHVKAELSIILKYYEDPERWDRANIPPQKGFIFAGPTRTGKSFIAEAFAGEIRKILIKQNKNPDQLNFFSINGAAIKQVGGIANLLEIIRPHAPAVLFIDEIDLLSLQRTGDKDMLQDVLTALSGFLSDKNSDKPVFILTATNKIENIDEAVKQPGRLGKIIHFDYPAIKEREYYLKNKLAPHVVNIDELDLHQIALESEGAHFENLNDITVSALQQAKINNNMLSPQDLENAVDREFRKISPEDNKVIRPEEKRMHAVNQAGHALAEILLPTGRKLAKVTTHLVQNRLKEEGVWDSLYMPETDKQKAMEYGKAFTYHDYDATGFYTNAELVNICQVDLAGPVAEAILASDDTNQELLNGIHGSNYHPKDTERAMQLAKKVVLGGIKIETLSKKMQNEKLDQVYELVSKCQQEVRKLLEANKESLQRLTGALLEKQTLTGQEVQAIISAKANKIDQMDETIKQPGRLGKISHFEYPTTQEHDELKKLEIETQS